MKTSTLKAALLLGIALMLGINSSLLAASSIFQTSMDPEVEQAEMIGRIQRIDPAFGKVQVIGADNKVQEFAIDSNTPILDHNLQIGLNQLQVGNRVVVAYNTTPLQVTHIDRY